MAQPSSSPNRDALASQRGFFSLATQVRLGLVLFVLVCLLSAGALGQVIFTAQIQHLKADQVEKSLAAAAAVSARFDEVHNSLRYLASVHGLLELAPQTQHELLEALIQRNPPCQAIAIIDRNGQIVASVPPLLSLPPSFSSVLEQSQEHIGPVEIDPLTQSPTLLLALPIHDEQGKAAGVLLARLNLDFIQDIISQIRIGKTGHAYLVDRRGWLIARTDNTGQTLQIIPDRSFIETLRAADPHSPVAARGLNNQQALITLVHLPTVEWDLISELPTAEAYALGWRLVWMAGIGLIGIMVLAIGVHWFFFRQVILPLRELARAAERISTGDMSVVVETTSRNEIGALAALFNQMAAQLKTLVGNLQQQMQEIEHKDHALRESEERYRRMADNIRDGLTIIEQGRVVYVNDRLCEILGYPRQELLKMSSLDIAAPEEKERLQRIIEEARTSGNAPQMLEFWIVRQDGTRRYIQNRYSLSRRGNEIIGRYVVTTDITERKQAEEALQRRLRELTIIHAIAEAGAEASDENALIERATQIIGANLFTDDFGVILLDKSGQTLVHHPSYYCRAGVELIDIPLGRGITGQVALDGQPRRVGDVTTCANYICANPLTRSELCAPLQAGKTILGVVNAESSQPDAFTESDERLLTTLAGQLATAIAKVRLLESERRRRQEAEILRQVSAALTSTLDLQQVLDNILLHLEKLIPCDSACVFLREDRYVRAMAGHRLPHPASVIGQLFPADNPLVEEIYRTARPVILADAQADPRFEGWGGTERVHAWMGVPLIVRGELIGHLTLDNLEAGAYGETEAALAQAFANQAAVAIENARLYAEVQTRAHELRTALLKQQELDRMRNEFIQNVSHELRTPLAIVLGYAELLESGELGELAPDQREPVSIIARRGRMLKKLVDDLTVILEAEAGEVNQEQVNLAEMVNLLATDFQMAAAKAMLSLTVEIEPGGCWVIGDSSQLRRVLDNLIGNAIKFTPPHGRITVRVWQEAGQAILEVSDTGIGIPADQLERIFERFYQVDGSMSRRYGGVGLGLALVKEIVQAHGGRVSVQSTPGQGSTFRVTLPALTGQ